MTTRRGLLLFAALLVTTGLFRAPLSAAESEMTPSAGKLSQFYDGLDVERHWIAGQHINWETGDPDGQPAGLVGRHTHCSAFVAAAAERLGIYILRPPQHGQLLLANAQNEWLSGPGLSRGWQPIADALAAQKAANAGLFVVASYHNHSDDMPGHIAIVRPGLEPPAVVAEQGPEVIQAGTTNSTKISVRQGFAGHPHAWADSEIEYYAHTVPTNGL
jgi:hypothetical protein